MDKRFEQQLAFVTEADKMKNILRVNLIADGSRRENDAEHSWHLALMALTLAEYAPPNIDLARVLKMALLHDLVEVYAGDTFAYDAAANKDKEAREQKAAEKLFGLLPAQQGAGYRALWQEFDAMQTPDAIYAAAIDRLQPFLLNWLTEGHTWKVGDVDSDAVLGRMAMVKKGTPELWPFVTSTIEKAIEKGWMRRGQMPVE